MPQERFLDLGTRRYRVDGEWPALPEGRAFGTTHAVTQDASENVYIHHTGSPSVYVFTPDGVFVRAWGEAYAGGAHGMRLVAEAQGEFLYLSATSLGFVAKVDLDGTEVMRIETPPRPDIYGDDHRFVPTETAVSADGRIFIADGYGEPWVHVFESDGTYADSFGGGGAELGRLNNPHGVTIGPDGGLIVADRGNHRLQYFTRDGKPIRAVGDNLRFPCTAHVLDNGILVADLFSRLTVLDERAELVGHLGDWPGCWERPDWPNIPDEEWVPGRWIAPHDAHVTPDGTILVVEWISDGRGRCTRLVPQPE